MRPPQSFGPEYLTYVLWAVTPEGRATNLGEVVLKKASDDDAQLSTTSRYLRMARPGYSAGGDALALLSQLPKTPPPPLSPPPLH